MNPPHCYSLAHIHHVILNLIFKLQSARATPTWRERLNHAGTLLERPHRSINSKVCLTALYADELSSA